jgi:hypothetical protein
MSKITLLGRTQISTADEITIELVSPADLPAAVRNRLAGQTNRHWGEDLLRPAAAVVKLFAEAATTLAAIKVGRKL